MPETSVLVVETSTPTASLALFDADGTSKRHEFESDRSHNARIFQPLQELIKKKEVGSISLVLVGSGPGSYSGTRVGISAAQGVAISHGCPTVAVPSILALPQAENGAAYLVIGDARRGSFWVSRVKNFSLITEPTLTDIPGLQAAVSDAIADGQAVVSFEDPSRFPLDPAAAERVRLGFPSAPLIWRAWTHADPETRARWTAAPPQPIYLNPPHITPAKHTWLRPKA